MNTPFGVWLERTTNDDEAFAEPGYRCPLDVDRGAVRCPPTTETFEIGVAHREVV